MTTLRVFAKRPTDIPTSAAEYDFDDMDPFLRDLGELQSKFMSLEY